MNVASRWLLSILVIALLKSQLMPVAHAQSRNPVAELTSPY